MKSLQIDIVKSTRSTKLYQPSRISLADGTSASSANLCSPMRCFRSLDEPAWAEVCEVEAAEQFDSTEWADCAEPARQHEFAELLRRALGEKVREWIEYDRREKLFYFRAPDDLSDVRLPGGRRVFGAYRKRDGGIRYRQLGFRVQFLRLDGVWYLEINPQYRFTRDGFRISKFQAENISKIKRFEHNDAVRQQVQALASFLNQPATLLTPEYRFVTFGELLSFKIDFGFDESHWRVHHEAASEDEQLFGAA